MSKKSCNSAELKQIDFQHTDRRRIELALRESQNQYHQIINELPDGFLEYDLKGNIISFNQATLDMARRTKEEMMHLPYKTYMDHETADMVYKAYNEVYKTGIPKKSLVHEVFLKDGSTRIVECSISLKKVNGKVVGFRNIWHDITERKRTEAELITHQSRLEAIFRSVKEGIIAVDAQGHVINANHAVENICGAPIKDIIGKPFSRIHTCCGRSCHRILLDTLSKETETKEQQIECGRHDNPHQVVIFNSSPLIDKNGNSMGAVLVIRDITRMLGLEKELRGRYKFQNIIGKSKRMQEIYDILEYLANLETTVLITGQSGTGKELVAKALHYAGERANKPFVKVNCSALTESLLESELFGHVKGAFTDAIRDRQGRFQMADGGTILLDEIGDISPLIQLKLLRVLQEKEFERVGESTPKKVDVRVIACTNKDLKEKVKQGEFREDLYYRLKVMEISLPSLNERLEDLTLLVDHFCRLFNKRFKKSIEGVSSNVLTRFMSYRWPGNIRELEHVLEHAFVLSNGPLIMMKHLPSEIQTAPQNDETPFQSKLSKKEYNAQEILAALEQVHWNKTKAANLLGINRRTIHRKIKKYHLLEK